MTSGKFPQRKEAYSPLSICPFLRGYNIEEGRSTVWKGTASLMLGLHTIPLHKRDIILLFCYFTVSCNSGLASILTNICPLGNRKPLRE